jgi:hypothetical protein
MKKLLFLSASIVIAVTAAGQSSVYELKQSKCTVYFDSNKSELKPGSIRILDSLLRVAGAENSALIGISAYCDNTGSPDQNQLLSDQRANAVYRYILHKGYPELYLSKKGFSTSSPVGDNNTEEGKAKNRRAEITVGVKKLKETPVQVPPPVKEEAKVPSKMEEEPQLMKKPEVLKEDLKIDDLQPGQILLLKNLNFVGGTAELLPE